MAWQPLAYIFLSTYCIKAGTGGERKDTIISEAEAAPDASRDDTQVIEVEEKR